jgi:LPXTG-motif cell wall-anchored protein
MRYIIALLAGVVWLSPAAASADKPEDQGPPEKVTICHVAGRADDPANYITLTLPWVAVYGEAGHFNEDGTPRAGHEQDSLGECDPPEPPPTVPPTIPPTIPPPVIDPCVVNPSFCPPPTPPTTEPPVVEPPTTEEPPVVVPPVTEPEQPEVVVPPVVDPPPPAPPAQQLPSTGSSSWIIAILGAMALTLGGSLAYAARRGSTSS